MAGLGFPGTSKFGRYTDTYTAEQMGISGDITAKMHSMPLGYLVEEDYGEYRLVMASAAVGANAAVTFTAADGTTVEEAAATGVTVVGVAMAAIAEDEYGWIRTRGVADCEVADGTTAFLALGASAAAGVLATPANTVVAALRVTALEANATGDVAVKKVFLH